MSSFVKRISMHMSFNGEEHMHISIDWLHVLKALSLDVHGCSCYTDMSNVMSMSK
jgi:hypothetical protein